MLASGRKNTKIYSRRNHRGKKLSGRSGRHQPLSEPMKLPWGGWGAEVTLAPVPPKPPCGEGLPACAPAAAKAACGEGNPQRGRTGARGRAARGRGAGEVGDTTPARNGHRDRYL